VNFNPSVYKARPVIIRRVCTMVEAETTQNHDLIQDIVSLKVKL